MLLLSCDSWISVHFSTFIHIRIVTVLLHFLRLFQGTILPLTFLTLARLFLPSHLRFDRDPALITFLQELHLLCQDLARDLLVLCP